MYFTKAEVLCYINQLDKISERGEEGAVRQIWWWAVTFFLVLSSKLINFTFHVKILIRKYCVLKWKCLHFNIVFKCHVESFILSTVREYYYFTILRINSHSSLAVETGIIQLILKKI